MKPQTTFILLYNGNVQYPSFDIKVLWGAMCKMVTAIGQPLPHSYVQVTRIVNDKHSYVHSSSHGHCWEIIERPFLYTRRKSRRGNTTPASIHNTNQIKTT